MLVSSALFDLESELQGWGTWHVHKKNSNSSSKYANCGNKHCKLHVFNPLVFTLNLHPFLAFSCTLRLKMQELWLSKTLINEKQEWYMATIWKSCGAPGKWITHSSKEGNYTSLSIVSHWSVWQPVKSRCILKTTDWLTALLHAAI